MRSVAVLILVAILGFRSYGQKSAEYKKCVDKSQAQAELNRCASDEAARADSELNAAYKELLAKIAGDPLAIEKIREAEKAWLHYRDAYTEAIYPAHDKQLAYGTEYPMDVNLLRAKLTREHLAAIACLMKEYQPTQ